MRPEQTRSDARAADPLRDGERLTPEEEREAEALLARLLSTPPEGPNGATAGGTASAGGRSPPRRRSAQRPRCWSPQA